jgi:hypothetical protein
LASLDREGRRVLLAQLGRAAPQSVHIGLTGYRDLAVFGEVAGQIGLRHQGVRVVWANSLAHRSPKDSHRKRADVTGLTAG